MYKARKKGRGKGYNWDEGKSNNALEAEEKGLLLAGPIAKIFGCTTEFIQYNAPYEEWHHVSGWFNKKRYFRQENVQRWWLAGGQQLWEQEKAVLDQNLSKTGTVCTIRFNEWENRKTVNNYECEALIIKQGKRLTSFEIRSEVWLLAFRKSDRKYIRLQIEPGHKPGDILNKKIEFVD
jgi:hypothetical protein